jgi:hypothetical protein
MSKTIRVIKPDGQTQTYEGTFDPETRTITTTTGKRVSPGANDTVEEGPCFVATAVYDGENVPQVQILRAWRDTVILPLGRCGQSFVRLYNRIGPHGARLIQRFPCLRRPMRRLFDMIVNVVER